MESMERARWLDQLAQVPQQGDYVNQSGDRSNAAMTREDSRSDNSRYGQDIHP